MKHSSQEIMVPAEDTQCTVVSWRPPATSTSTARNLKSKHRLGPGHRQARPDRGYRIDLELCSGCTVCLEQCPRPGIEMAPEPTPQIATGLSGEATSLSGFKISR